jgi:hypothetical protein
MCPTQSDTCVWLGVENGITGVRDDRRRSQVIKNIDLGVAAVKYPECKSKSRRSQLKIRLCSLLLAVPLGWQVAPPVARAVPQPSPTDIPEEVLRAEIITEARSPIDGRALSASEFIELAIDTERQLSSAAAAGAIRNPKLKETILLLRLRGFLRSVGLPIK